MKPKKVSIHGGHSGQFCNHAAGSLEEMVTAYIDQDFSWVGITEHMPPVDDSYLYPEERQAGLTAEKMYDRFVDYFTECRRLQERYSSEITLYAAMEIETYCGCEQYIDKLIRQFAPDYLVGSVHHVDDVPIDYSAQEYERAAAAAGGVEQLYCRYFDQQYRMIERFRPAVIGHFDLIRIYDPDYLTRMQIPEIVHRIQRNLDLIQQYGLILDLNLRALFKGAEEPYITRSVLLQAREKGISVVPGDDSHSVDSIGMYMEKAIALLQDAGFSTDWKRPVARS